MRSVTPEVSAYLDATTLGFVAHAFTLTPRAEVTGPAYWTDTDANFTLSGHTFVSAAVSDAPAIEYGGRDESVGMEVGSCRVTLKCAGSGHLGSKTLPVAALDRDLDGAWMKIERVFLSAPGTVVGSMWLFEGPVSKASPTGTEVGLEVEDGKALLRTQLPRVIYQPGCVNQLFDGACGLVKASFTATGTVAAGSQIKSVLVTPLSKALNFYNLGALTFTSGVNAGVTRSITKYLPPTWSRDGSNDEFQLDMPLSVPPSAGDTFTVYPGCDKTLGTCRGKWGRTLPDANSHYRGFPFIPKNETTGFSK